ncbi:MAG: DUF6867 family protein [Pseudomonadota bacterium]
MGFFWEEPTPLAFLLITLALGGGAAWMTGRAVAGAWEHPAILVGYTALLACAARFLHFALAGGSLLTGWYWSVDFLILLAIAGLSFRVRRAQQMTTQYFWLYERTSPISWREIEADAAGKTPDATP